MCLSVFVIKIQQLKRAFNRKMKNHLISVIIPTYNRANYICEAVDSVLAQTYKNIEIIIVDDGSTDNTKDIVLQRYNSKVTYILQNNSGPSSARNNGVKHAKGDLIAFLDSDDVWLPEKLEKQVKLIDQSHVIGLVACGLYNIDSDGNIVGSPIIKRNYINRRSFLKELMIHNIITGGGSNTLIRRECFEKVGFFEEDLWIGEDWNLWLRIAKQYEVKFVEEPLIKYRIHGNNLHKDLKKIEDNMRKNILRNINRYKLITRRKAYSYMYIDMAHEYIDIEYRKAFINAVKSIISYPLKSYSGDDKYRILCKYLLKIFSQILFA